MSTFPIASDGLLLELDAEDPLRIRRIVHANSQREIAVDTRQQFLVRMPDRLSDPYFLTEIVAVQASDGALSFVLTDERRAFRLTCSIKSGEHGVTWSASIEAPKPLWMLEWHLRQLDVGRVVVPALGGQVLDEEMPAGGTVAYKYPFWWQAQFAVCEIDRQAGMWIRTTDARPRLKMLRLHRDDATERRLTLGLGVEAEAPLDRTTLEASWHLDGYTQTWKEPADIHRAWMREAFDLRPLANHPRKPAWVEELDVVLEIWGMSKEAPDPKHTFDEMMERVRAFAEHYDPHRTLLYLPGFAQEGIDSNAPDYGPAEKCGGRDGFRRLVDTAHELGFRVMVHTNVLALAYSHPLYQELRDFQVVDCFGRLQGWGNDLDGDWLQEPFFAYVNPGHVEWSEHMQGVLADLIDSFAVDAVFLDQTLLAFNVSRGPNFIRGMREHVERLQRAFPDVLFAGEGFHEQIVGAFPLVQIHGIDSITGIHGLEGARKWRHVHPISTYLFRPYTRIFAHLLTKHPSNSVFERQESAYERLGVLPALVLYNRTQRLDVPQLADMLERAQSISTVHGNDAPTWTSDS